jgi:murein DD-endopeptidase MepM/ murein hydrolase activator NlpD
MKSIYFNKKIGLIFIIISLAFDICRSQTQMTGNLADRVNTFILGLPSGIGTDEYQVPTTSGLSIWGNSITKLIQGQYAAANDTAALIGYRVLEYTDNTTIPNKLFYVLEKTTSSTNYWGMFVYNPYPVRSKLFIQSPHPKFDLKTGQQGFYIFKNVGARAYFTSGTHRCNSSFFSSCSGTTDACGTGENFRKSDQPHNVDGTLQKATEILKNNISNLVIIQNHGFSKGTGDPDVIMGNGTTSYPTGTDYLVNLKNNLFSIDNTLTFKVAHIDIGWTTNIGTTNTQGRLLNGSSSPCNQNVSTPNGRFLHIEQAYAKLRDTQANWDKLSGATTMTFPVSLTLSTPNGGEAYNGNSSQTITWTSSGDIANVKLEYSADNGQTWLLIISNTPNNGSYSWTLPKVGTWRARVRISAVYDSTIYDVSNNKFTIDFTGWPISDSDNPDLVASPFGTRLLSGVYDFHRGIDLPNNLNTPVHPVAKGIVVRFEDTSQTVGTTRERYGNWILVQHQSVGGEPRHTAYMHLNAFNDFSVGDTVSTLDTIGFMGKSGVGINTIHTHLELEKNLSGTSMDKDKAFNPLEILFYNDGNNYSFNVVKRNDSTACQISVPSTELDFDKITIYGKLSTKIIAFNQRIGIDPSDNDNPRYNGVYIDPERFTKDSTIMRYRFWTKDSEVGTIDSFKVEDIKGFATTYSTQLTRYAVVSGNWTDAIWATTPSGIAGSAATPDSINDIVINSGIIVTNNGSNSKCKSASFGNDNSKFALNSGSVLNVYGNFNLASSTHSAFSTWSSGAKVRFKGNILQTINNLSTSTTTTTQTYFMELQVDKTGDTLKIPKGDYKLNIGTSLEILNGNFRLDSAADIQGRSLGGASATAPPITVNSGGTFSIQDGHSHIGSGTTGTPRPPVGKVTVYGSMSLTTKSTNKINFSDVDVESGGVLSILAGWSNNLFNPGTITIKNRGTLLNNISTNFWATTAIVNLNNDGIYRTNSSATIFPPVFNNNGIVCYQQTVPGDQTITDMNYYRLEISNSGSNKVWTLASSRTVMDSLEINNDAILILSAATPQTVLLNGNLCLNSGILDNSGNANLVLNDDVTISRAEGLIINAPVFGQSVNVKYNSSVSDMSTGPELPASNSVLQNLILASTKIVYLNADAVVNGDLIFTYNRLITDNYFLTVKGQIIGADENRFVEGELYIPISKSGLKKWEIGQAGEYLPLVIAVKSVVGSDSINAVVLDKNIDTTINAIDPGSKVLRRYHRINKGVNINEINFDSLSFYYSSSDIVEQGINEGDLNVYYNDGPRWKKGIIISKDTSVNRITIAGLDLPTDVVISATDIRNTTMKEVYVTTGWNLVSVPLATDDMRKDILFRTSISPAYSFKGSYTRTDTLSNGVGYWIKFALPDTTEIVGLEIINDTIPIKAGWNLIGVYSADIDVSAITSTPTGIINSNFFGYQNGYFPATTLVTGNAYWIKVTQNGVLNIPITQKLNGSKNWRLKNK